jgi:hypothetical protein
MLLTRIKARPLSTINEVGRIIHDWQTNQPQYNPQQLKVLLGVEKAALPRDLRELLQNSDHYQDYCGLIAFCDDVYLKRVTSLALPAFNADESELTMVPCPGFPVTRPVEPNHVKLSDTDSFAQKELDNMFGPLAKFTGQMMVLSLGQGPNQLIPLQKLKTAADIFLRKLAGI